MITFSQLGKFGRFGNQMFQAAGIMAFSWRNNDDYILPFCDLTGATNIPLDKFSNNITFTSAYTEPHYHYSPIPYKPNLNIQNSYLQSYKYFEDYSADIKKLLMPNVEVNKMTGYTSIHVRRTDYLTFKNCYHTLTRENYYDKAMECSGGKDFLIFSDDITWCKREFSGNEFEFVEGNPDYYDMTLMANCDGGHIIANSSFSWWGGYLSTTENSKVICPTKWFGPELEKSHNTKDLFLERWVKV